MFRDPRNAFRGLKNYKTIFWSLRFHGRLFFKVLYVDVQRLWQPDDQQIKYGPLQLLSCTLGNSNASLALTCYILSSCCWICCIMVLDVRSAKNACFQLHGINVRYIKLACSQAV